MGRGARRLCIGLENDEKAYYTTRRVYNTIISRYWVLTEQFCSLVWSSSNVGSMGVPPRAGSIGMVSSLLLNSVPYSLDCSRSKSALVGIARPLICGLCCARQTEEEELAVAADVDQRSGSVWCVCKCLCRWFMFLPGPAKAGERSIERKPVHFLHFEPRLIQLERECGWGEMCVARHNFLSPGC